MDKQYKIWLDELQTMPGRMAEDLDPAKMLFMDVVQDVPGFDKRKTLAALNVEEVAFRTDKKGYDEVHGYSDTKTVAVRRNTPWPTAVLWHELGHILCDHTKRYGDKQSTHLGIAEAEAMSVAYLLCNVYHYNEPKPELRGYVQHWYKGKKISAASAKYIMAAADKIIEANGYSPE